MVIRAYGPEDDTPAINLWNACLPADQIDRENFYNRIIYDVNFNPSYYLLAFDGDETATDRKSPRPIGFIYFTRRVIPDEISGLEAEKGWIVAAGVRPGYRMRGAGRALVEKAESLLADAGVKEIDVGTYATNYFCPGVDKNAYARGVRFFESLGYIKRGECCSMDIGLHDYVYPEKYVEKRGKLEERGYKIIPYVARYAVPLFNFIRECFPHWLPNVRACALSGKAPDRMIIASDRAGNVVGFVMRAMDGSEERFGPFGIKPELRGIGLGSLLFHEMMLSMNRRRIFYAYFLWTSGRNLDIYASWGMKIYRTYCLIGKNLN